MLQLSPDECRVLGVLVEKAQTTPDQYPLTLNGVVNGANQKNNREPVLQMGELQALAAVNGLRDKGLLVQVDTAGGRVSKYRHRANEKLEISIRELVVLAELLLRGPQTLGELRGRASRMHPLDSLEMVKSVLDQLSGRPEPMVKMIDPAPGSRAERYMQLLCPDLHPLDGPAVGPSEPATPGAPSLSQRVGQLEAEVVTLRSALKKLAESLGVHDLLL